MARDDRRVTYPIDPATTALVSVDFQVGFGRDSWVPVPHAEAAVRNFIVAAHAWREVGGTVIRVPIPAYTPDCLPTGRMTDFLPMLPQRLRRAPLLQLSMRVSFRMAIFSCARPHLERL